MPTLQPFGRVTDPYLDRKTSIERLMREYEKHKKLIVAVDFDDTIYDFHQTGNSYKEVINLLKRCQKHGFYIVIFTASAPEKYGFIQEYCQKVGLNISAINENPIPLPFGNHRKIYYNILLDDRSGLWEAVCQLTCVLNNIEMPLPKN